MTTTTTMHAPISPTGRSRDLVVRHPLLAYFVIAFGFSWVFELLAFGLLDIPELPGIIVAAFGPPVAAMLVTRVTEGATGVHALLGRILLWRVGLLWSAFVFLVIPVLGITSFVFLPDGTDNLPDPVLAIVPVYLLSVVILASLGGGQEELGWRGFALPLMQSRFEPLIGTALLGVLWGLWHLPLYVLVTDYNNAGSGFLGIGASFLGFVGYTVALAAIMTWVFNGTRGSVLLVMLVHGAMNANFGLAPETRLASWSLTLMFAALALVIVAATRGQLGYHRPDTSQPARSARIGPQAERMFPQR